MPDPDRLGVTLEPIASMTERQRPKNPEPARAGQGWRTAGMPEKEVERELLASNRSDGAFAEDLLPQGPGAVPADLQMSPEAAGDSNVLLREEPEGKTSASAGFERVVADGVALRGAARPPSGAGPLRGGVGGD